MSTMSRDTTMSEDSTMTRRHDDKTIHITLATDSCRSFFHILFPILLAVASPRPRTGDLLPL